jgi:hypothetical protein
MGAQIYKNIESTNMAIIIPVLYMNLFVYFFPCEPRLAVKCWMRSVPATPNTD